MGILSRLRGSLCWAVLWQLLAANLLVVAVEYLSQRSGDSEGTCRWPSLALRVLAVFSRTLAAVMGISYQECVLQQLRRRLLKAVVVDAFVLFLKLRSLYCFIWLCIGALRKPLEEETTLEIKEPSLPEENRLEDNHASPSEVDLERRQTSVPEEKSSSQQRQESQPRNNDEDPELSIGLGSSQATATPRSPPSTSQAAGDGMSPKQPEMEPQLPEFNPDWKMPTQHADAAEQPAGMTPNNSEITPCLQWTPQLAGITPKRGEMMQIWELPDEITPEDDEIEEQYDYDEMTPEDDEIEEQYDYDEMTPPHEEIIRFGHISSQHYETTSQKAEVTLECAEMAQCWGMAPEKGDMTPQQADTTPQNTDKTPQQDEITSQHSDNSKSDSASSS